MSNWQARWELIKTLDNFVCNTCFIGGFVLLILALVVARAQFKIGIKVIDCITGLVFLVLIGYVVWRLFFCWWWV